MSKKKNRADAVPLDGTTQQKTVYIFATPPADTTIRSVRFYLDGKRVQLERNAPYDFAGGSVTQARAYDVCRRLEDGSHSITAVFKTTAGDITTSATFDVACSEHERSRHR